MSLRMCIPGSLGTSASGIEKHFTLKDELISAITGRWCSPDELARDYAFYHFNLRRISEIQAVPPPSFVTAMNAGLKAGKINFQKALMFITDAETPPAWKSAFQEAFDQFTIGGTITDDDVPF